MSDTVFIYALNDPQTGRCRYVGKAVNPVRRFKRHLNDAPFTETHKDRWIRGLLNVGEFPVLEVLDEVPKSQWEFWEQEYIRVFRLVGIPLTNLTDGGDGAHGLVPWNKGRKHTEEHRKKISLAGKGRRHSVETRRKMSLSALGKEKSSETRGRMSKSAKVKIFSPEHRKNLSQALRLRLSLPEMKEALRVKAAARVRFNGRFI